MEYRDLTPEHVKTLSLILENNGRCDNLYNVDCPQCPFDGSRRCYNGPQMAAQIQEIFATKPRGGQLELFPEEANKPAVNVYSKYMEYMNRDHTEEEVRFSEIVNGFEERVSMAFYAGYRAGRGYV